MTTAAPETHRVLVVDDEPNIVDVISMALRYEGFDVDTAGTGAEAPQRRAATFRPQLIVLDIMLPDMEGFEVARRLGADGAAVPIIFLTARDATEDKVRGLTMGGDDYVTKPFSLEELVARIRAVLRRTGVAEPESRPACTFADLELDDGRPRGARAAGRHIDLTATEYRLLRYLMLNPRRVLTRAQILDHVWDYDFGGDARVARDLHQLPAQEGRRRTAPPLIHTVRGVGYALRRPAPDHVAARAAARPRVARRRGARARAAGRGHLRRAALVPRQPRRQQAPVAMLPPGAPLSVSRRRRHAPAGRPRASGRPPRAVRLTARGDLRSSAARPRARPTEALQSVARRHRPELPAPALPWTASTPATPWGDAPAGVPRGDLARPRRRPHRRGRPAPARSTRPCIGCCSSSPWW